MMNVLENENHPRRLRERYRELFMLMQIRDIREIIFKRLEVIKETFRNAIEAHDFSRAAQPGIDGRVIFPDTADYRQNPVDRQLEEYFDFLSKHPGVREMVLEEFYSLLKPLYEKR